MVHFLVGLPALQLIMQMVVGLINSTFYNKISTKNQENILLTL